MKWRLFLVLFASSLAACSVGGRTCRVAAGDDGATSPESAPPVSADGDTEKGVRRIVRGEPTGPQYCHRRRFAVCIGINGYRPDSGFAPLSFAAQDAADFAEVLADLCGFEHLLLMCDGESLDSLESRFQKYTGTSVTLVNDLSYRSIDGQVIEFLRHATASDDLVLFYFSGHGESSPAQLAFLVPTDFHRELAPHLNIPITYACSYLFRFPIQARNKVVLIDACRAEHVMGDSFIGDLEGQDPRLLIMASCDKEQASFESNELGHGRFTWALIESMKATANANGQLWIRDVSDGIFDRFVENQWSGREPPDPSQDPRLFARGPFSQPKYFCLRCPLEEAVGEMTEEELATISLAARGDYQAGRLESSQAKYAVCVQALSSTRVSPGRNRRAAGTLRGEYARVLYRLGHLQEAQRQLASAAALSPDNAAVAEVEGYRLLDGGKYAEASQAFANAIARTDVKTDRAFMLSGQGLAWVHQQDFEAAADAFLAAARATPETDDRLRNVRLLARSRLAAGDLEGVLPVLAAYKVGLGHNAAGGEVSLLIAEADDLAAQALLKLNRPDEARDADKASRDIRILVLGKDHPAVDAVRGGVH